MLFRSSPDDFLAQSRPLKMDELTRENIDDLKSHILSGGELDPLQLYQKGLEDGRHRAMAAKELGISEVPVINFREQFPQNISPDALLGIHGIRSHRLGMVEKLGGLPVPSIAIAKPAHGYNRFGDINLVASPELIAPRAGNPVFASDVYSPRFPSLSDEGDKIFRGFTNMGNRRYAPLTMENVVREMKGNVRGGEGGAGLYGAGSVRSAVTPQFKTLKQIQEQRGKIIPSEEFKEYRDKANDMLLSLADEFHPYSRYSGNSSDHTRGFMETLADVGKGRLSAFNQDYKDLPDELKQKAFDYLKYLREMPTEYFEAKPQRAVQVGEFAGAVVPENLMSEVEPRLRGLGLRKIVPYNPEAKQGQQKAFHEIGRAHV